MQNLTFSFVVPVYKIPEKFLHRCVESMINQTYKNIEIILIDDGSADHCCEILDKYKEKDNRLIVIHKNNEGVSSARNDGIKASSGDYIIFVDADDMVNNDLCEVLNKSLDDKIDFCIYKFEYESQLEHFVAEKDNNIEVMKYFSPKEIIEIEKAVIQQNQILDNVEPGAPWGKVFSRSFLVDNNLLYPQNVPKTQDRVFMLRCLQKSSKVSLLDYFGYIYNNKNEDSVCKAFTPNILDKVRPAANLIKGIVENSNHYSNEEKIELLSWRYLNFINEFWIQYLLHPNLNDNFTTKKNTVRKIKNSEEWIYLSQHNKISYKYLKTTNVGKKGIILNLLLKYNLFFIMFIVAKIGKK